MTKCTVDGCEKTARSGGLCSGHEHRLRRYGSPTGKPAPKPLGVCAVEGCGKGLAGGGYCVKHYKRFRAHGVPLGGSIDYGSANAFVAEAARTTIRDECVTWPFGRDSYGYGRVRIAGVSKGAHVAVAELAHGNKPSRKHEACHTCGNGHLGCVNPHHLYWGTRSENVQDAIAHGTAYAVTRPVGEASPNAKFSDATIAEARRRMNDGETPHSVAVNMGISPSYIYNIRHGRSRVPANDNEPGRMVA